MKIKFGSYEYTLVPDFPISHNEQRLECSILADNINVSDLESILKNKQNLVEIEITGEDSYQLLTNYNQLLSLYKNYQVEYGVSYETVVTEEAYIDPDTGENVPETVEEVETPLVSDIITITLRAIDLAQQVSINTANIEFLAIMNDIEL